MSHVRFGIVGLTDRARQVCEGLGQVPECSVTMLMDTRPRVLAQFGEHFGVPTTANVADVLGSNVDAVYITASHPPRASVAMEAAEAGKHVLIESPVAENLAEADAVASACKEHNVLFGAAFRAQVDAGLAMARDYVRSGILGEVIGARLASLGDRGAIKSGTAHGEIFGVSTDDLNTVRWVTGLEATRVYAEVKAPDVDGGGGMAAIVIRYENGAVGVVQASASIPGGEQNDAPGPRIYCTKGQLILGEKPLVFQVASSEGGDPRSWQQLRFSGSLGGPVEIVRRFAEAVISGGLPSATGDDARKAMQIVVAALRAQELGRPVQLPLEG